jgi:hypothetical protein
MFDINETTKTKDQEVVPAISMNKFYKMANDLYLTSHEKIEECNKLIVYLEQNVMDINEENEENENNRKSMRPLTNELMNQVKMNRNLLMLLQSDILLIHSKNKEVSLRLVDRFTNLCKEITSINSTIIELGKEFNNKFSDFLKNNTSSSVIITDNKT